MTARILTSGALLARAGALPGRRALRRSVVRHVPARILPVLKSAQLAAALLGGGLLRRLPGSSRRFGPPRRLVRSLVEYAAAQERAGAGAAARVHYAELFPSEFFTRAPPRLLEAKPHPAFDAEMRRLSPPAGIAAIADGRVLTRSGAVIAPGDCLIADVSSDFLADDPRGNELFLSLRLPPVTRRAEAVAVLTMPGSDNYFHWLFDTLPRLRLLEASGIAWDRIVLPRRTRFQRDGAALLGLDEARIIDVPDAQIEAAQLIVPGLPGVSGNPPGWACAFLRERFLPHAGEARPGTRKIYVSRRQSGTRKVLNEDELFAALAADGFELFFLEDLAFLDQVRLFHGAGTIVSAHGSGLSNLVFCPPGAGIVELFSPAYVNVCYWALANQLGLEYRYVLGVGMAGAKRGPGLVHENMRIDVARVQAALRSIG